MFKKLARQLKIKNTERTYSPMSTPMPSAEETRKLFLKTLSEHALNLYEHKTDVKNFTRLALSDPENTTHNDIVEELISNNDVVDVFDDDKLFELSENKRFLEDLGLD